MKLSKLFFGLATAAMFAACSSDDIVEQQTPIQWNEDGTGYMALSVSMPSPKVTRANDKFDDGLESEFSVKNAILVLFQGSEEASATVASAYDIKDTNFGMVQASDDNVTSDKLIVQKIQAPTGTGNIYAFVVLNNNGLFKVNGAGLEVKGTPFTGNLAALQALTQTSLDLHATAFTGNGFLMSNAPLSKIAGGTAGTPDGKVQVLAPIAASAIKGTAAEARANVAANVYVERAVVKVTFQQTNNSTAITDPQYAGFAWKTTGWTLDNTNTSSYLVRNTAGFADWAAYKSQASTVTDRRFVGAASVAHTGSTLGADGTDNLYRTYFAKDTNYDTDADLNQDVTTTLSTAFGNANPQYCAENTFEVDHMIWGETTRVLLSATLTPTATGTLYGRPGDQGYYTEDALKTLAFNHALEELKKEGAYSTITGTIDLASSVVTVGVDAVKVQLNGISGGDATLVAKYKTTGETYSAKDLGLRYYTSGENYYQVRIRHFDDSQTPWNTFEAAQSLANIPAAGGTNAIYPANSTAEKRDADYLGRYGVLRNNWYDLDVTSVKKLGYPEPDYLDLDKPYDPEYPNDPNTPDDNIESWISVDVNVLSWAKRTQHEEL